MDDETRAAIKAAVAEAVAAAQPGEPVAVTVFEPTPVEDQIAVETAYQEGRTETEVAVIEATADAEVAVIEAQAAAAVDVIEAAAEASDKESAGGSDPLESSDAETGEPALVKPVTPEPDHWLFRKIGR